MIEKKQIPKYLLDCLLTKKNADLPSVFLESFTVKEAYKVSNEIHRLRQSRGEKEKGIKIGFTNKTIWDHYNVNAPIFGRMYSSTILEKNDVFNLEKFLEPKLEPEIFFRLVDIPNKNMNDHELLSCCSHFGLGVELVQSVFKDWKFTLPDTVAGFGLHGQYKILEEIELPKDKNSREYIATDLKNFTISLMKNGKVLETGRAENILGEGPIKALRAYVNFCSDNEEWLQLDSIITTGTVTDAYDMKKGLSFSINVDKFDLAKHTLDL